MGHTRSGSALGAAALIAVVVAACSSGAGAPAAPAGGGSFGPTPTMATEHLTLMSIGPVPSPTPAVVILTVHHGSVGTYVTDSRGMSLYIRTTDSANKSTCDTSCLTSWPPLLLQPGQTVQAGTGVTGKVGSFKRPDGSTQVTLSGMPLYYFSGDTAAGQTNGQGVKGVWFLAAPAGGHLTGSATSSGGGW